MRAAYNGHEALTFPGYLDLDTGKTLHAEPGGTYDITPAGGPVPDVPVPWFTPLEKPASAKKAAAPIAEPEPGGEPGTGKPVKF